MTSTVQPATSLYRAALIDSTEAVTIWWGPEDPTSLYLSIHNPHITDELGKRPGLMFRMSSNPRSADYRPADFNRCVRTLKKMGKEAPNEVPVHPRHLKWRPALIERLGLKPL